MNAAEPNSEIIACGQCGTKNRPKAHEAGKALVCGNCKAPLAQQQQPNTLSNTSMHSDGNGAVYYNRNNWLITQHSISTPEHIIRLSDVQRIEVKWCAPIMNTRDKQILALLAVGGCVVYFLLNGFTLNWPHILYCALPSVIWFGYASENSRGSYDWLHIALQDRCALETHVGKRNKSCGKLRMPSVRH